MRFLHIAVHIDVKGVAAVSKFCGAVAKIYHQGSSVSGPDADLLMAHEFLLTEVRLADYPSVLSGYST